MVLFPRAILVAAVLLAAPMAIHGAEPQKGKPMSYGDARALLAKHTELVELTNDHGARVAICPGWQGRVMTSTCDGMKGPSFGFINEEFITAGKPNPHFNNYGGEDRMWLSPEGGQFSLWFKPGDKQELANWFTPPALNEIAWKIVSRPGEPLYRMAAPMTFQNTSGTQFKMNVTREVRLLNDRQIGLFFGAAAAKAIAQPGVKTVAYETMNRITNNGEALTKEKGLASIWMLGMFNSGPQTVVVIPYKAGPESELGPIVKSDYFGQIPADRLKITPEAILFRADGNCRSKLGVSQRRARAVLGSIDFQGGVLTLANFTMPDDPTKYPYMNNMWGGPHDEPFTGDVVNSYNDGPPAPGQKGMGPFYEIESLSPAKALQPGESLEHCHRTVHLQADAATLKQLAKEILGVDLDVVRSTMLAQ